MNILEKFKLKKDIIKYLENHYDEYAYKTSNGLKDMIFITVFDYEKTKLLIEKGVNLNVTNFIGFTPLMEHVNHENNDESIIQLLVLSGADVNAKCLEEGRTPLMYSANIKFLNILLNNGADIKAKDNLGNNILFHSFRKEIETFEFLIKKGADVKNINNQGHTLLHEAARHAKNPQIIDFLVSNGLDINSVSLKEKGSRKKPYLLTPLMIALEKGNLEIAKAIMENGADIKLEDRFEKNSIDRIISNNKKLKEFLNIIPLTETNLDTIKNSFEKYMKKNNNNYLSLKELQKYIQVSEAILKNRKMQEEIAIQNKFKTA